MTLYDIELHLQIPVGLVAKLQFEYNQFSSFKLVLLFAQNLKSRIGGISQDYARKAKLFKTIFEVWICPYGL